MTRIATVRRGDGWDVELSVEGTADLHSIEEFTIERRRVTPVPNVSIRCGCGGVYELDEYSGHIGTVTLKVLREMGVLGDASPEQGA